jgi:hypothetical protein
MMRKSSPPMFLLLIAIVFITSCSSSKPQTTPSVNIYPSTATFLPATAPIPTEEIPPDISNTPMMFATQFCMGSIASWSCTCGDLSIEYIEIKNVDNAKKCDVTMPHAYRIRLSDDWYCNVAGVARKNLACITAHGKRIFIQALISELPLANAEETVNRFCEGDGCISNPVMEPEEERIEKGMKTIGDKPVLRLLNKKNDTFILRYFIENNDNLYMFRIESKNPMETQESTFLVEEMINSMEFVP